MITSIRFLLAAFLVSVIQCFSSLSIHMCLLCTVTGVSPLPFPLNPETFLFFLFNLDAPPHH